MSGSFFVRAISAIVCLAVLSFIALEVKIQTQHGAQQLAKDSNSVESAVVAGKMVSLRRPLMHSHGTEGDVLGGGAGDLSTTESEEEESSSNHPPPIVSAANTLESQQKSVLQKSSESKLLLSTTMNSASESSSSSSSTKSKVNSYDSNGLPWRSGIEWSDFTSMPLKAFPRRADAPFSVNTAQSWKPVVCSKDVQDRLSVPILSKFNKSWCDWALSKSGGQVVVGKSWGKLERVDGDKKKFDNLNCNAVSKGLNPTCNDKWGDAHMRSWRRGLRPGSSCDLSHSSKIHCYDNENNDRFCVVENLLIDFALLEDYNRPGSTDSRKFQKGFLAADCSSTASGDFLPFPHLFSPKLSTKNTVCDHVINGTTLLFSHDDIRNAGHFVQDAMNAWVMLWLAGVARSAIDMTFLNVDSFYLGHNFHDEPNHFFETYRRAFGALVKGSSFGKKKVCLQRALVQPTPPRFFVRDGWNLDQYCSFVGPSSMYQRFNVHVRNSYGLIKSREETALSESLRVYFIVRKEIANMWGNMRIARIVLNMETIKKRLQDACSKIKLPNGRAVQFDTVDLAALSLTQQMELFSSTSIIMGTHGAGIALANMHLGVGSRYCCGVLEIYPRGEFTPIRGHGNMAR